MSVTAILRPETYEADAKLALQQFFATYFNGAAHTITRPDGTTVSTTFPLVTVEFDPNPFPRPLVTPLIRLHRLPSHDVRRVQTTIFQDMVWQILSADAERTKRNEDSLSALIGLVCMCCAAELAKAHMRFLTVGQPLTLKDDEAEYNVVQRLVTIRGSIVPGTGA